MQKPNDLIPSTQARTLLGVSPAKMSSMLRDKVLQHWTNPLDKREKLVSRAEVLSLQTRRDIAA
jgi:hypothetical protein